MNNLYSSLFIFNWLAKSKEKIVRKFLQGGQGNLSSSIIKNLNVKIPDNISEQNKVGRLIGVIDEIIELHQRKINTLEVQKKAYLNRIFPNNNETTPRLRFDRYTEEWEHHKFSDLLIKLKSYSLSRNVETTTRTGTKYIHYGDIHTGVADKINNYSGIANIRNENYETLQKGDIILADASEDYQGIAEPAVIVENTEFEIVSGLHTIALRPTVSVSLFLYYLIKSPIFRRHGYRTGTGMKVFGITSTNVLKFETYYPNSEEQFNISNFLVWLDEIITLHHSKLSILKKLKKAYLNKMFI